MKLGQCYTNATKLALERPSLRYVEGKITCCGVPIDHAWNVNLAGELLDPTLENSDGHLTEYFGVEFSTEYLRHAIIKNGYYGLLDGFYARKTIKDLINGKANFR